MASSGMRGLSVFISDIRNCQNKEIVRVRVDELGNIRTRFNNEKVEVKIEELTEEMNKVNKEKDMLNQELASFRQNSGASATGLSASATARQVQIGFPFLFVDGLSYKFRSQSIYPLAEEKKDLYMLNSVPAYSAPLQNLFNIHITTIV